MSKRKKTLLFILLSLPVLLLSGFVAWSETPLGPLPEAVTQLQSDGRVQVTSGEWIEFRPAAQKTTTGFIFYPGGRVDARSYAPAAREIAAQGYLVVIVPMPFNLAVFDPGAAAQVIAAFPEIQHWVTGGHSLGGAMAANYARKNPGNIEGLVLWASYPASGDDLSMTNLKVLSVYGTLDSVASEETVQRAQSLLPVGTQWVPIEGGNHAQFGSYGFQPGDARATISAEAQRQQVVKATVALLQSLEGDQP